MNLNHLNVQLGAKNLLFKIRSESVGDHGVVQQMFQHLDYDVSHWEQGKRLMQYHLQQSVSRQSLIIDAGANIGASVVYFKNTYEGAYVFAIEPQIENWQLLEINTASYSDKTNFYGAISNTDGVVNLVDPGLSDWGFRTLSDEQTQLQTAQGLVQKQVQVKSISPTTILADSRFAGMTPLMFKIDIEGAEEYLFAGDTSWMQKFAMIVIELHDWMLPFSGSSKSFLQALVKYDFDFVYKGENIFLFNRRLLNPSI